MTGPLFLVHCALTVASGRRLPVMKTTRRANGIGISNQKINVVAEVPATSLPEESKNDMARSANNNDIAHFDTNSQAKLTPRRMKEISVKYEAKRRILDAQEYEELTVKNKIFF